MVRLFIGEKQSKCENNLGYYIINNNRRRTLSSWNVVKCQIHEGVFNLSDKTKITELMNGTFLKSMSASHEYQEYITFICHHTMRI